MKLPAIVMIRKVIFSQFHFSGPISPAIRKTDQVDEEKETRLNNLFSRVIAEANNENITEDELMEYILNRRK